MHRDVAAHGLGPERLLCLIHVNVAAHGVEAAPFAASSTSISPPILLMLRASPDGVEALGCPSSSESSWDVVVCCSR